MKVLKRNCDEYITTDTTLITADTTLITTDIYYSECFINGEQYYYFQFMPRQSFIGDLEIIFEDELSGVQYLIDSEVIKVGNFYEIRFFNDNIKIERKYNITINNNEMRIYEGKAIYTDKDIQNYNLATRVGNKFYI